VSAMYCPVCDRKLELDEFHPAYVTVPAHWLCGVCDCRVNEYDDEFEAPPERAD
jgi:hypothetical protein